MRRPALPYLLLLPLLAVLLFGNCGGGVNRFLYNLEGNGRLVRFDSLEHQRQRLRVLARQQLHGRPRHDQLRLIEQHTDEQIQPLLKNDWERRKFANRRNKIERQRRRNPIPKRPALMVH